LESLPFAFASDDQSTGGEAVLHRHFNLHGNTEENNFFTRKFMRVPIELEQIDFQARQRNCNMKNLVNLAKMRGVAISEGSLSEALRGIRLLNPRTTQGLLDVLGEMKSLETAIEQLTGPTSKLIKVDWSRTQDIAEALVLRTLAEVSEHEQTFQDYADVATILTAK
jgi:hypothetical protein